jgi:hypothetical protein
MDSISEKNFPPDTLIVDAVALPKDNRSKLLAGALLGGFFGWILFYMLFHQSEKPGMLYVFTAIALALTTLAITKRFVYTIAATWRRRQLDSRGIKVKATVVGRESDMNADPEMYWAYYQFHPDFVGRHYDETKDQYFFNLPTGHTIEVLYLPESPQVTAVIGPSQRR